MFQVHRGLEDSVRRKVKAGKRSGRHFGVWSAMRKSPGGVDLRLPVHQDSFVDR
jgi:hypothetical protein